MPTVLWILAVVSFTVGLFYAFNAYIQFQERGFAEATDVPIAVAGIILGALAVWRARRARARAGQPKG